MRCSRPGGARRASTGSGHEWWLVPAACGIFLLVTLSLTLTAGAGAPDVNSVHAESLIWIRDPVSGKAYRGTDFELRSIASRRQRGTRLNLTASDGYTPAQVRRAYQFDRLFNEGDGQVIAIVNAYHHPNAASALKTFIDEFGLRSMHGLSAADPCTVAAGPHPCFEVLFARGVEPPLPPPGQGQWLVETFLDTQWAHAIAPGADILLVEASSHSLVDLVQGVHAATVAGGSVVSMSWGAPEFSNQSIFEPIFNVPGVTFIGGAGDDGHGVLFPASSSRVLAVGGTKLPLDATGDRTGPETAWDSSGGGISEFVAEPGYQSAYPIPDTGGRRGNPDVAYNADPETGVATYIDIPAFGIVGWFPIGGTSAGAPQWSALTALANELRGANLSSNNLLKSPWYDAAKGDKHSYTDITSGSNGACGAECTAGVGYDFVTGLGSPRAHRLVCYLAQNCPNVPGDFDGDGRKDLAVYRPATGEWFIFGSATGLQTHKFGAPAASGLGDTPVPADFDGDGKTDLAVYRQATGEWFVLGTATGFQTQKFGAPASSGLGDIPVPADFDGDGLADLAIYRKTTGEWFIFGSATGFRTVSFGAPASSGLGDIPVPADFDDDGKADLAVYRKATGEWFISGSLTGFQTRLFGAPIASGLDDIPVQGDFDGDGQADLAVRRNATSEWLILLSSTGQTQSSAWGAPSDLAVPQPAH